MEKDNSLGDGIYSVSEIARLTRIPAATIKRWARTLRLSGSGDELRSPPPREIYLPSRDPISLSFRDLIEVCFADAYLRRGTPWEELRVTAVQAATELASSHPLSDSRFRASTDDESTSVDPEVRSFEEPSSTRGNLPDEVHQALVASLEFDDDQPSRWYPCHPNRDVVLDPRRSFGQPIVDSAGIPTFILAQAAAAEDSLERAAESYRIRTAEVQAAVDFETQLTG